MVLNIFNIISILSLFLTFVLSIFFISTKNGNRNSNHILALFLILFGFQIVYSFTTSNPAFQYFMQWHKVIYMFKQTSLLIGPAIYFYIYSFTKNHFKPYTKLIHYLPFLIAISFLAFFYSRTNHFIIWQVGIDLYITIGILLINLFYIILSVLTLRKLGVPIKNFYNEIKKSSYITWIHFILLGFVMIWIINLNSFAIVMIVNEPGWCAYTASIYALVVFLLLTVKMFVLLLKPEIYYAVNKYKNSGLDSLTQTKYLKQISDYFESEKPFLNPEMSIDIVAAEISINSRILSQLINEFYEHNFNSFVNDYRIKESLQQLSDVKNEKTILEILYDSGFNSKSAFYTEFKRQIGLTPLQYRAKCRTEAMAELSTAN